MVRMVMGMMVMLMVRERVLVLIVMAVRWRLLLDDIALVVDAKPNMKTEIMIVITNPDAVSEQFEHGCVHLAEEQVACRC